MYTYRKALLTNNNPYRSVQSIKAFVFHYTGNESAGANALANRNYFQNNPGIYCSSNYIVDQDNVLECIAPGMVAFHAGGDSYTNYARNNFMLNGRVKPNDYSVGFEMCNNSDGSWSQTVNNTIEFAARLAVNLGIPNVELIRHYDVTWKDCPAPMVSNHNAWEDFKHRLRDRISELSGSPVSAYTHSEGNNISDDAIAAGVVRVNSYLNMRESASTSSNVVSKLSAGSQVSILSDKGEWYEIKYSGKTGYVAKAYIEAEKIGTVVNISTCLNVRSGAGSSNSKVGSLSNGTKVIILGNSDGWYNISGGGVSGWVSGDYITVSEFDNCVKSTPVSSIETDSIQSYGTVTASVLNVRKSASTDSEVVGTLSKGDRVKLDCKVGNWWSTYYGEHGGFVYADYITT